MIELITDYIMDNVSIQGICEVIKIVIGLAAVAFISVVIGAGF